MISLISQKEPAGAQRLANPACPLYPWISWIYIYIYIYICCLTKIHCLLIGWGFLFWKMNFSSRIYFNILQQPMDFIHLQKWNPNQSTNNWFHWFRKKSPLALSALLIELSISMSDIGSIMSISISIIISSIMVIITSSTFVVVVVVVFFIIVSRVLRSVLAPRGAGAFRQYACYYNIGVTLSLSLYIYIYIEREMYVYTVISISP